MQENSDRERFKSYLRKIGSGEQTGRGMSRAESEDALNLILKGIPSPAQIGAFMIAHRIRRPEIQELAGMLDTYLTLGPKLRSKNKQRNPICFGMPFDGRVRTAPIYPLTTLLLISAGQPVILHGGRKMPVKYGVTTEELFRSLGLNLKGLTIKQVENGFWENNFAFIYQPEHFQIAETLIQYREEIGKRPPIASMELLWTAHQGKHLMITGFVHPPTEERHCKTLQIMNEFNVITIKGLEGSTDLSIRHSSIIGRMRDDKLKRIILKAKDYDYIAEDMSWKNVDEWRDQALQALNNEGPLKKALEWNGGIFLWLSGVVNNLEEGLFKAKALIASGSTKKTLKDLSNWRQNI